MKEEEIKKYVRERYGKAARQGSSCCQTASFCCGGGNSADIISKSIGYTDEDLKAVPEGANLGLGCGNPIALASLKEGDTVLDLGSGAGFDCFLASRQVGKSGKVIGVDMTPDMLEKAKANAKKADIDNVEFRLGEIENLPVGDNHVDVVISNCVINLSPTKDQVFRESFRVLKAGGRLMVSDIVLLKELPEKIRDSVAAYTACVAGAETKENYLAFIQRAGFQKIQILDETVFPTEILANDSSISEVIQNLNLSPEYLKDLAQSVISVKVSTIKPALK